MRRPKRKKPERMGVRPPTVVRSPGHLKWVRGFHCSVAGIFCTGNAQAAHVRTGTDGGTSMKPGDNWAIPLCAAHHGKQHQIGEAQFERVHGIDMKEIAADLWSRSPHRRAWERKLETENA